MGASATRGPTGGRAGRDARGRTATPASKPRPKITSASQPTVTARQGRRRLILLMATTLFCFGVVMVASASSGGGALLNEPEWGLMRRQASFGMLGFIAMIAAAHIPLELVRRLARPAVIISTVLLVAVMVPGLAHEANGAARWIRIGPFQLQPSELLKLSLVVLVADHLSRVRPPRRIRELVRSPGGASFAFAAALVALQSDLGTALVIGAVTVVLYMLAGSNWRLLARTIGPALALVVLSIVAEPYRRQRFMAFWDPWADPTGPGYQLVQALIAIGSGGPFGVGLGHSVQKIHFLPEAHTDMIFAIVVEELGVFGLIFVLGSFAVIAAVGVRIAMSARSRFSGLLAAGLTAMVVGQAAVNVGGVTGVMPLTGIPLPLVSYGGSSLIVTLTALGLLANIAVARPPTRLRLLAPAELAATDVAPGRGVAGDRGAELEDDDDVFRDLDGFDDVYDVDALDEDGHGNGEGFAAAGDDENAAAGAGGTARDRRGWWNRRSPRSGDRGG